MPDTPKESASGRRLSLTKTQRESDIGAELLSLCQVVTADGSLSDDEVSSLREWLQEHKAEALPAISHLIPVVERIVADGRVTSDESRELFIAVETVLPPDVRGIARNARRTVEQKEKDRLRVQRELEKVRQREERERNDPIEHWDFMVAGSRYEGRPAVIDRHARVASPVHLVRDPDNRHSRNTVQVHTESGHQIGFVPEDDAADVAPLLDAGHPYSAQIKKILTGGQYPIPVVIADIYRKDATVPSRVRPQTHVPRGADRMANASRSELGFQIKFALIVIVALLVLAYIGMG
jgi:HIRAN domain